MNLRELWEPCGNSCGNWKNRGFARIGGIYKREFPQFPHALVNKNWTQKFQK